MRPVIDASDIKIFKAISNGALKGAALPTRLKVLGWGDNQTIDGIYRAGDKTTAQLSANQKRLGFERVAIDFNHCTVPGTDSHAELMKAGQPPLIFGYGRVNAIPGDGIFLEDITWTPLGVQHARNFEDLSPALKDDNREVTMIHSVALTPNGKVNGLQFFSATTNQNTMNENITIAELGSALGLKADSKREDVLARLGSLAALSSVITIADGKITALSGLIADGKIIVLGDLPDRVKKIEDAGNKQIAALSATIDGQVKTFSAEDLVGVLAKVESLAKKIEDGEKATTETAVEAIVKTFAADGKVPLKADGTAYSAAELKALDLGTLQILKANTPVTVALSARGLTAQTDGAKSKFRDEKGNVNMAALLEAEAQATGQIA